MLQVSDMQWRDSQAARAAATVPARDVMEEVGRLLDTGQTIPFWVMGGAAIQLHCRSQNEGAALSRAPFDIDVITSSAARSALGDFLGRAGYVPNERFNALNSRHRLLFYDLENDRQLDVFIDRFAMCHQLDLIERVNEAEGAGLLPPAELLMTKLQIVQLNQKDLEDIAYMLVSLPVNDEDASSINGAQIARVYARDWGLWRTAMLNVERLQAALPKLAIDAEGQRVIGDRLRRLSEMIESEPKSRRWRARSRIGDRVRWYEMPEEVAEEIVVHADSDGAS